MPQTITTGYKTLLEAARREVEGLSVDEARALHGRSDVVFVDIRDPRERDREGSKSAGAEHNFGPRRPAPRRMARQILRAHICFHLNNFPGKAPAVQAADEDFAE